MSGAQSLVCQDCGTQLKSVAEAQTHGEVTGHANFAESVEAVLRLVCTECTKPCRSETEKTLHTQRTGHANFQEIADAAAINTQAEMKTLRNDMLADAGIAAPKEPMDVDEVAAGSDEPSDTKMVEPKVDQKLLDELVAMGFPRNRALRAIFFSSAGSADAAINWIVENESLPDIDQPLVVPEGSAAPTAVAPKKALTREEAKAQAKEMIARARKIKDAEEKKMEVEREKQRIKSGKEMLETKRKLEEMERKRGYEIQRREKQEAAKAKAEILARLEADRRERRIKKGLPPEESEEEKTARLEKEAASRASKNANASTKAKSRTAVVTDARRMRDFLVQMKQSRKDDQAAVTKAYQTLNVYCSNVLKAPHEDKFRRVNLQNAAFQTRVGSFPGGIEFLKNLGFEKNSEANALFLASNKVDTDKLKLASSEILSAMNNPFFGTL